MAVVFLMGGTGNQLFAFATSAPEDTFSPLLLSRWACRILGWTYHPSVVAFPRPRALPHAWAVVLLLFDLALIGLGRQPLYTECDTHWAQTVPRRRRKVAVGYFMLKPMQRSVAPIRAQLERAAPATPPALAVHIRGGDARAATESGWAVYGDLRPRYYRRALESAFAGVASQPPVTVFTDDAAYATSVLDRVPLDVAATIDPAPLRQMLAKSVCADTFIASNSTLSYWIVVLRGAERRSIVPCPFLRGVPVPIPAHATALPVKFG